MIIGDYSFAAAFIISGVVGLVMSWLTGDAVDGIKKAITDDGKETRNIITADGDKTRKDNEETRAILREILGVLKDTHPHPR